MALNRTRRRHMYSSDERQRSAKRPPIVAAGITVTVGEAVPDQIYGYALASLAGADVGSTTGTLAGLTVVGVLATNGVTDTFLIYFDGDVRAALAGKTITGAGLTWGPLEDGVNMSLNSGLTIALHDVDVADLWTASDVGAEVEFTIA